MDLGVRGTNSAEPESDQECDKGRNERCFVSETIQLRNDRKALDKSRPQPRKQEKHCEWKQVRGQSWE